MDLLTTIDLETPEQVELKLDLAGPATRFAAQTVDWMIQVFVVTILVVILLLGGFLTFPHGFDGPVSLSGLMVAVIIVAVWLLFTFYGFLFEWFMRGQTPGKVLLGLRVISDLGGPPTMLALLLRNVMRIVDFLPTLYLVGGVICAISSRHQRLGDMAAGTLVIRELPPNHRATARRAQSAVLPNAGNSTLSREESELLRRFFERRADLAADARRRLAERLADQLFHRHGGQSSRPAEQYLENLYQGTESSVHEPMRGMGRYFENERGEHER